MKNIWMFINSGFSIIIVLIIRVFFGGTTMSVTNYHSRKSTLHVLETSTS